MTLLEVVVSTGIMSILTGITLVGLLSSRRASATRQAAEEFAGFLRETATMTLSGVRGRGCAANDPRCYQYRVIVGPSGVPTYTRRTRANTDATTRALPSAVIFPSAGTLDFRSEPPTLALTFNGTVVSPGSTVSFQFKHRGGGPVWRVCVSGLGRVSTTASAGC